ncbi:MAG: hypothetical protein M9929_04140 [Burkholderiaceae bacterium]|nr:hypothetical protein [Burkholderiaceae bacterium]
MKTATHQFNTVHGLVTVDLEIFDMDAVEAVDVYEQDRNWFGLGGWSIEGMVNGTPRGTRFYGRSKLGAAYFGEGTEDAAREFLASAHQDGFLA